MMDIKFITEDPAKFKKGISKKHFDSKLVDELVKLNEKRKKNLLRIEELRAKQNQVSKEIPNAKDKEKEKLLKEMGEVKEEVKKLEPEIEETEKEIDKLAAKFPNPPLDSVPEGEGEQDNKTIRTHGKQPKFDFAPKDHATLGKDLDIIDIERGVRTSGTRFYYLKGAAALMEFALIQHVIHKLNKKGFTPVVPPVLVKEEAMFATGFFPADRNQIYHVNPKSEGNSEGDDLFLVGTSEVPLTMLHYTEILENEKLPIRYCGFSSCFRREAGAYGKDAAGIIRVHQFDKIEMYIFCKPEDSEKEHELILATEEEIMQDLGFHYRIVNICGGDLGAPAAKKYDIEVWIPSQNTFRELTSCSNCTDFQARRSKIRFKADGKNEYVHTLNGTACAVGRTLVAIFENYQNTDGSITIPKVLQPYMGEMIKIEKNPKI